MGKLEQLVQKIAMKRKEENPFPDDFEAFLEDFIPNTLLKSETLQLAFGVSNLEMEELYREAYTFYEEDLFKEASHVFRFLVILDPFTPRYWMGLGATLRLLSKYEKALHAYAVVTLLERQNPEPHFQAYECYKALGDEKEAALALEIARECVGVA